MGRKATGLAKAEAPPGAEVTAEIAVPFRCLAYWGTAEGTWVIESGDYQLCAGSSSRDLSLPVTVTISPGDRRC